LSKPEVAIGLNLTESVSLSLDFVWLEINSLSAYLLTDNGGHEIDKVRVAAPNKG
jgi:hypothetical protein